MTRFMLLCLVLVACASAPREPAPGAPVVVLIDNQTWDEEAIVRVFCGQVLVLRERVDALSKTTRRLNLRCADGLSATSHVLGRADTRRTAAAQTLNSGPRWIEVVIPRSPPNVVYLNIYDRARRHGAIPLALPWAPAPTLRFLFVPKTGPKRPESRPQK
jgi:hypothetical protein